MSLDERTLVSQYGVNSALITQNTLYIYLLFNIWS